MFLIGAVYHISKYINRDFDKAIHCYTLAARHSLQDKYMLEVNKPKKNVFDFYQNQEISYTNFI